MAGAGAPQRICGYNRESMVDGVPYVAEEYARRLVLENRVSEVHELIDRRHLCVSPVLTYSVKRGKHAMTQFLISEGVTVTREAVQNAARLGGPGMDLLLAGISQGEALDHARHDALHAWLLNGEFDRAMTLLEAGVRPTPICYNALQVGAKHLARKQRDDESWRMHTHRMLDRMLPLTLLEHVTHEAREVVLDAGRPIHVERMLELVNRPPSFLFITAMRIRSTDAIQTLRQLGLRMDDSTFHQIAKDLVDESRVALLYVRMLLDAYVEENGQTLSAKAVRPLLYKELLNQDHWLNGIRGPDEQGYERASKVLLPYLKCMDPNEHLRVYEIIDQWAAAQAYRGIVPPHVTAVLKHVVLTTNQLALQGREPGFAP
jgi:hypothetical protein